MKKISIVATCKKGATVAKFSITPPLDISVSKIFINIDQAADAPLVKQLFFLPFVKKVALENSTLIVERFEILEWEEVIQEVAEQIEDYLNEGGAILNEVKKVEKIPVTVYAESTPNPATMKFVVNKKITDKTLSFENTDSAQGAPLVKELFNFPFVKEVFMDENYISVSKNDTAQWEEVVMEIRGFIKSYLEEEKTILDPSFVSFGQDSNTTNPNQELNDTEQEIVKILEEYVKPAVASDGGNIIFDSYEDADKRVKVVLQGACSGCPSSTFTLKNGIENILKEMLPGKVELVEAVNG
ncbi:NifU family protein [Flavobacteriaceae bacterium]|nr:NifU family protein [Flavobacteriaceae bacterium]MDC3238647.1 NifU family protein [Flavobacteriaceae bacterium]